MVESLKVKKWAELTAQEEESKLRRLAELLKEHGLESVQPVSADHQVNLLRSGYAHKQSKLMISGKVSSALAGEIKKFTKKARQEVLADVNPYTFLIRIDVAPVAPGESFIPIKGLKAVATGEDTSIEWKEDQILVITFCASWCEASIKVASELNTLAKTYPTEKVRFETINLDDSLETAAKLIKENGWDTIQTLNIGSSSSDLTYGANMIPRVVLVDAHGKIAYIGHPKKLDLQQSVTTLAKSEAL